MPRFSCSAACESDGPGIELMSPALAGGLVSTVPPGKPHRLIFEG